MNLLSSIGICALLMTQLTFLAVYAYEGCVVRFGRKGCTHRILEGVLVVCDGLNREKAIPTNVPKDTVYLSLKNFKLNHLQKSDFEMFSSVECLSIVDSGINKVDPDAFSSMTSLMELSLEKTHMDSTSLRFVNHDTFHPILLAITNSRFLTEIDFQATKNLNDLKTLNLAGNHISEINREIFEELKSLEALDLSGNQLGSLDWESLNQLSELNKLFLDNNKFQQIPKTMYGVFFAVKELTLSGNRLHCNCKLQWLREFYDIVFDKTVDLEAIECRSPRVRRFTQMTQEDFVCSDPSVPELKWSQLDDYRYELNCTSHGDPSPTLFLSLPDGRTVITPPSQDLAKLHPRTPQIVSKKGHVTCEARNTEGRQVHAANLPKPKPMISSSTTLAASSHYVIASLVLCAMSTLLKSAL